MATKTNLERSTATRAVLEATVEAIVRFGCQRATSARIADVSGMTRGARIHPRKTKPAMFVQALLHLHAKRLEMYRKMWSGPQVQFTLNGLPMRRSCDDDIWIAASELWNAARTDGEPRAAAQRGELVRTVSALIDPEHRRS